ncbi:MAG: penicillin acylase family protein [Acidimicrobiia bacterium]|nr:penicillin acylase family protein [Acidimicrobiia bacterium]
MSAPRVRRVLRVLGLVVLVCLITVAAVAGWAWWQIGRSRPQLTGERTVAGLSADVTIDRDNLGVPAVRAATKDDLARALGFLHAQDRFFQMDLARRRAAGELSELFGRTALTTDRNARLHRFRARATAALAHNSPEHQAAIVAYAEGVNAGLAALAAPPFEYLLLRQTPRPWTPEDSVLVITSMFFNLQDATGLGEARMGAMADVLPLPVVEFLNSTASEWDTPELGSPLPAPVPPGPEVFDLRTAKPLARGPGALAPGTDTRAEALVLHQESESDMRGSNNWAVAGSRTADGRAIVADDMHLGLGVPNIWYRASMTRPHNGRDLTVTGATLPGVPAMIVGSNGSIAWGFTNTTADWTDRVLLEVRGEGDTSEYRTPDGWRRFDVEREMILIDNEAPETIDVRQTIWGPVDGPDAQGRLHAIVWVAHFPEALNLRLTDMDTVTTLDDAIVIANLGGLPAQNVTMADNRGGIAWTIGGRIPRREGFDGRYPTSWADGTRRWNGWYGPDEYPRIVNPESGVIVTANNRIVSDGHLALLGDGGYDPGARARQIRDGLLSLDKASIADMLSVQLDDRAILMTRWRDLALTTMGNAGETPERREFVRLLQTTWTGRASADSVAYRLVRQFRLKVTELAWAPFVARVRTVSPNFPTAPGRGIEGPIWALVTTQPPHLLDPKYSDWSALLVDAIDQTIASLTEDGRLLSDRTWGEANTLTAGHPLSRAVPQLAAWLNLPATPLPGDSHMPRFQSATNGASERFAVSPGDEGNGYFHMPGGQSGHPRSPHYRDGHNAWVVGTPTPFLPGPAVARLVLKRE